MEINLNCLLWPLHTNWNRWSPSHGGDVGSSPIGVTSWVCNFPITKIELSSWVQREALRERTIRQMCGVLKYRKNFSATDALDIDQRCTVLYLRVVPVGFMAP